MTFFPLSVLVPTMIPAGNENGVAVGVGVGDAVGVGLGVGEDPGIVKNTQAWPESPPVLFWSPS
ncbi:MAG: hypothetical protein DMF01_00925 [Verrucomicrobia bacterium]|nr:MAG: hypothetical protein DMF01_00925 [Verrucomicrobiota bacterium]